MDWPEIKRRLTKEGTSVQILADLEGVPYKTMYQRIKWHERQDGKKYMPEMKPKKKKQAEAEKVGREIVEGLPKFEADPEEKEERPEVVPVIVTNDYSCKGCANCIQTSFNMFCEMGHECGENRVCSEYKAFPKPAQVEKPEILTKKLHIPEEKPEIPEEVYTKPEEVPGYAIQPETIDELNHLYFTCKQLAEKYQKQADDWLKIMSACASWSNARYDYLQKHPEDVKTWEK